MRSAQVYSQLDRCQRVDVLEMFICLDLLL